MPERVALFLPSLRGGGAQRVMLNLALGLQERGVPVDLVLVQSEGPYLESVPDAIRLINLRARRVLTSFPALVRYLRCERPSAVVSALHHVNITAVWARAIARVPARVVVTIHNSTVSEALRGAKTFCDRTLVLPLASRVYLSADSIVAVSAGVAEDFARTASVPRDRINVIYNPVISSDLEQKASEPLDHPWFQAGEPPVVLGIGRMTAQKDFPTLLRAFALLRLNAPPARLVILGEGPERERLEQLAQELEIGDHVAMPGFDPNPFRYMARARVFALSSAWEGLPTVLIEAMACGCNVVATDCPSGPREILDNGRHGILVPSRDPQALAAALSQSLAAPQLRHRHNDALHRYTLSYATNAYLDLLNAIG